MSEEMLSDRLEVHLETVRLARIACICNNGGRYAPIVGRLDDLKVALIEAAQLARRVEEAPVGEVWQHMVAAGQRTSSVILTREPEDGLAIIGQRVRLVRE